MALQLSKDLGNGFSGNYWKIRFIRIDKSNSEMEVQLVLFKDAASRQANLSPVSGFGCSIYDPDFSAIVASPNIFEGVYAHLKTLPQFAGAVDC